MFWAPNIISGYFCVYMRPIVQTWTRETQQDISLLHQTVADAL